MQAISRKNKTGMLACSDKKPRRIPADIDYNDRIEGLATEARQKFEKIRPETLAQAERISGVNSS